jgi:phosphoglycerate dehydrogenase-like enzyme
MQTLNLLAIADSEAFLSPLKALGTGIHFVSDSAEADIILYAGTNPAALRAALPFATRTRWIHSLWTGVEGILGPELQQHPAPLTNGRGVFRWPLADWVAAAMLHFALYI